MSSEGWQRLQLKLWNSSTVLISGFFISVFVCSYQPRLIGLMGWRTHHIPYHMPPFEGEQMCITKQRVCGRTSVPLMAFTQDFSTCGAFMAYDHEAGWWIYRQQCWMCLQNWRESHIRDSSVICCCQFPVVVNTSVPKGALNNQWAKFDREWLGHVRLDSCSLA